MSDEKYPAGVKRPLKVFLCHASADKPKVRELFQRLLHDGIDAWLDESKLLPGMEWELEIPKAVREADAIVICLSNNSVTKEGYVQKEIRFALDVADEKPEGTIYLIPVRLEACAVPSRLVRWQWVDLFSTDGYRKLRRSLRLRADALGAGFSSAGQRLGGGNHELQVDPNSTETPPENEELFNFGLTARLFVLLTLVILGCLGVFQLGAWISKEIPAQEPSPAPTFLPLASATPEPPVATRFISFTPALPSAVPVETATAFLALPPTYPALPTQTLKPIYNLIPPTPTAAPAMVFIPPGTFVMGNDAGNPDEKPAHTVILDAFYLDQYEVTNRRYAACIDNGICKPPKDFDRLKTYSDYPVVKVSWDMAKTYCEWRGARLPTEAEWEKAARGGLEGRLYPWGTETPVCVEKAQNGARFKDCQKNSPTSFGAYAPNGYQLYDMVGNVWEWVSDWYDREAYAQTPLNARNPQGPASGQSHVVRGGGWASLDLNLARRNFALPETQDDEIGFRCARSAQP